jgi:hypothetical protein
MAKEGTNDLETWAGRIPWRHDNMASVDDIIGSKTVTESTGRGKNKVTTSEEVPFSLRDQKKEEINRIYGVQGRGKGGLGVSGSADYTRIGETAQRIVQDPDFYRFRGQGEGGASEAENWSNFVSRVQNQTPGLGAKTGSLGAVWQDPQNAAISAIDRHMLRHFGDSIFANPADKIAFESGVIDRYNTRMGNQPENRITRWDQLPAQDQMDAKFAFLNNQQSMKTGIAVKGAAKQGAQGPPMQSPRLPTHLQGENARWISTPDEVKLMSGPYTRLLEENAKSAKAVGQGTFSNQWMLWDRIRNRLEPHEIMNPGLAKVPRMSLQQHMRARQYLKDAGYLDNIMKEGGKPVKDPYTGNTMMLPVEPMGRLGQAAYF